MSPERGSATDIDFPRADGLPDAPETYRRLRDRRVHELPDRPGIFVLSRYEDVRDAFSRPDVFAARGSRSGLNGQDALLGGRSSTTPITETDGAELKRKRAMIWPDLKPGRVRAFEEVIRTLADRLIDGFCARGEVEFVSEFAHMLPLRLTMSLMDLPAGDEPWLRTWADAEIVGLSWMAEDYRLRQADQGARMMEYLAERILERQKRPGVDVISSIIAEQVRLDGTFDLGEVRVQVAAVLFGGIATTGHFLASAMLRLLDHPDQMQRVIDEPAAIPAAIEESLRLDASLQWNPRRTTRDVTVGGTHIPAGSFVLLLHSAANHDETQFADPEHFDLDRANARRHLAFGFGPHSCLGAPLARLEARVAYERLLARLPDIRLAVPRDALTHLPSPTYFGLARLPLRFEATAPLGT